MKGTKSVRLGRLTLGGDAPTRICVPLQGADAEAIGAAAARARISGADLVELRMDSVTPMPSLEQCCCCCEAVRTNAPELPILLTIRTQRDGGLGDENVEGYTGLLLSIVRAGLCEAVDVELSVGERAFRKIALEAHGCGICVVGSSHEFGEIGDLCRIDDWFARQAAYGADVLKAAVMAHSVQEALALAGRMADAGERAQMPFIAIAMGREGLLTRLAAPCLHSCLSFASAGQASAPGQVDAGELREIFTKIRKWTE